MKQSDQFSRKYKNLFTIYVALIFFFVPFIFILTGCGGSTSYANLTIKDWSNYSAIGAGFVDDTSSSQQVGNNSVSANRSNKKSRLIGMKEDGTYEEISFVNDKNKETNQKLYVYNFKYTDLFTFVQFSRTQENSIGSFGSMALNFKEYPLYLIDNRTGKMYDIGEKSEINLSIRQYLVESQISSDSYYTTGKKKTDETGSVSDLYRISVENGLLKIEECLDLDKLGYYSFIADSYNNLYIGNTYQINYVDVGKGDSFSCKYLYKDGTIRPFEHKIYKANNGYVYNYDTNQQVNENGEFISTTFAPTYKTYFYGANLIYEDENSQYYYRTSGSGTSNTAVNHDIVYKLTKINDIEFECTPICLPDYEKEYSVANGKIYFLDQNEVYYVDLYTSEKTTLSSNYIFNKIYSDRQGNIIFEGINYNLDDVIGTILPDNTIVEQTFDNGFDVYYLSPINLNER